MRRALAGVLLSTLPLSPAFSVAATLEQIVCTKDAMVLGRVKLVRGQGCDYRNSPNACSPNNVLLRTKITKVLPGGRSTFRKGETVELSSPIISAINFGFDPSDPHNGDLVVSHELKPVTQVDLEKTFLRHDLYFGLEASGSNIWALAWLPTDEAKDIWLQKCPTSPWRSVPRQ